MHSFFISESYFTIAAAEWSAICNILPLTQAAGPLVKIVMQEFASDKANVEVINVD